MHSSSRLGGNPTIIANLSSIQVGLTLSSWKFQGNRWVDTCVLGSNPPWLLELDSMDSRYDSFSLSYHTLASGHDQNKYLLKESPMVHSSSVSGKFWIEANSNRWVYLSVPGSNTRTNLLVPIARIRYNALPVLLSPSCFIPNGQKKCVPNESPSVLLRESKLDVTHNNNDDV